MDKLQEQKELGDDLFAKMVADIKQYIHERFQVDQCVPCKDEILLDMVYVGNNLQTFINGIRSVRKYAAHQFTYRLSELVRVAESEYEGRQSA